MRRTLATLCLLASAFMTSAATAQEARPSTDLIAKIRSDAGTSACARYEWLHRRLLAPRSYIEGMAVSFARAVCHPDRDGFKTASAAADLSRDSNDALYVYDAKFRSLGMRNDVSGPDVLRHSYTLLLGLGMMESSGKFCEGRDVSQCFIKAENAEAGLFQTSYGAKRVSPALPALFEAYSRNRKDCMPETFSGRFSCPIRKSKNKKCPMETSDIAGTGPGADWQRLTKSCPGFAVDYGVVVLRKNGGPNGEFNPIRKGQAEVRPECDRMFKAVADFVQNNPAVCSSL